MKNKINRFTLYNVLATLVLVVIIGCAYWWAQSLEDPFDKAIRTVQVAGMSLGLGVLWINVCLSNPYWADGTKRDKRK